MCFLNKGKSDKKKIVTIEKVSYDEDKVQYHVKVNGLHVIGGNCSTLEEAEIVFNRKLSPQEFKTEVIKKIIINS